MSASQVTEQGVTRQVPELEGVWTCGGCGSQLFFLHEDASISCSRCHHFNTSIIWIRQRIQ